MKTIELAIICKNASRRKAFTLIEIIVVISIIGILAAVLAPNSTVYIAKSKDARTKEELSNIRIALSSYVLVHNGNFPVTLKELYPDFIRTLPVKWEGTNARGFYSLDSNRALVYLSDESGQVPSNDADSKGIRYGDY
jgi:prepilin-type N-terminal cleavage/methylation domain-containing protein